eukprot:2674945-Rhodomonas_salina.2
MVRKRAAIISAAHVIRTTPTMSAYTNGWIAPVNCSVNGCTAPMRGRVQAQNAPFACILTVLKAVLPPNMVAHVD